MAGTGDVGRQRVERGRTDPVLVTLGLAVTLGLLIVGLGADGWAVGLVVGLVVVAAYPFLRRLAGAVRNPAKVEGPGRHAPPEGRRLAAGTGPFASCSTSELTAAWTASHELLETSSSTLMRVRIVALRQECLDELERRDPLALQRWLACAAPASVGPGRFLTRRDDGTARPEVH